MLGPIKTEIMSDEHPFQLIMFHDILSDSEIEFMQKEGINRLTRAGLFVAGNTDRNKDNSKVFYE